MGDVDDDAARMFLVRSQPAYEPAASSERGRKKSGLFVQVVLRFPLQRVQDQAAGNGREIATAATCLQYLKLIPCDGRDGYMMEDPKADGLFLQEVKSIAKQNQFVVCGLHLGPGRPV